MESQSEISCFVSHYLYVEGQAFHYRRYLLFVRLLHILIAQDMELPHLLWNCHLDEILLHYAQHIVQNE